MTENMLSHQHEKNDKKMANAQQAHCRTQIFNEGQIVTIRSHSGLSGDMLLTGFAILNMAKLGIDPLAADGREWLKRQIEKILPDPGWSVTLRQHAVHGINGWQALIALPDAHNHRHLADMQELLNQMQISAKARTLASKCFELLARCEAAAHGVDIDKIHFHEVGAMDSILDICGVCEFYTLLEPLSLLCSPLPVCDGSIMCAHGILPAPAPATLRLLKNIPVRPFVGDLNAGELITPTAIALLHALEANFGAWPDFIVQDTVLVYGQKEFANAPNGCFFALGRSSP